MKRKRPTMWTKKVKALFGLIVVLLYVHVSSVCWAIRNPEMTQTQRVFHLWDAILWR